MTSATYPSLKNKTVFVTGGAMGIGEAFVRSFAAQGCKVAFVDVATERGEALKAKTENSWFETCDVTDIAALRTSIASAAKALGPIGVLVNNAANDQRHKLDDVTPEYWDNRLNINIKHQFFAAQAIYPMMRDAGGGAIINLGSTSWKIGQGGFPAYTTAKASVNGLTRSLARDLGIHNIRVNTLVPGWIMTERQLALWVTPETDKLIGQNQCLKRRLQPDDVARVAVFLASDEAGACTNQEFVVDGGWV